MLSTVFWIEVLVLYIHNEMKRIFSICTVFIINEFHYFLNYNAHCVQCRKISFISCTMCSTKFYLIKKNVAMTTLYCFYFLSTKTILIIYPVKLHLLSLLGSRWLCYVYVKYWFPSLNKIKLFINIPDIHVFSSGQCLIGCTRARPCS